MSENLRDLVNNLIEQRSENESLDYKEKLELNSDRNKYELAKDIAAFANTKGGHIVIGVEDATWTPKGVDPTSVDKTIIFQIADSRIIPTAPVDVNLVEILDRSFFLLSISYTGKVHELSEGRVPIRKGNITCYASAQEIYEMKHEEIKSSKEKFLRSSTAESVARDSVMSVLPEQLSQHVTEVLQKYSALKSHKSPFDWVSRERRERRFLRRTQYEKFCRAFLNACEIKLNRDTLGMSRSLLDLLAIRVYGLLAALAVSGFTQHQSFEFDNITPLKLTLSVDPSKMANALQSVDWEERQAFFQWARRFSEYEEDSLDGELLENMDTKPLQEQLSWMKDTYGNMNEGLIRGNKLMSLNIKMNNRRNDVIDSDRTWIWSVVLGLLRDSSKTLSKMQGISK